jgi:sorbitol-6-phosphate 2-dehydrogenase
MNTQIINLIAPALRGLLAKGETLKLITFLPEHDAATPLLFEATLEEEPKKIIDRLRAAIAAQTTAPKVVRVKNVGFFLGSDPAQSGRVAGKVALVTGAAQGFGLEIAQNLATQGAHVVLADVNIEGARRAADQINSQLGPNRALGLSINVADPTSVESAINEIVKTFGGLDILISNAGVLRAGSVKTLSDKDFDLSTNVNYKGYFLCVQKTAPIMAVQRLVRPENFFDIIQINSKSGLQGSNRNAAYAGSKFGGIGLTQSFALELIDDGIKVNSICPGNFFDGPLWSDPTNGLFVQYLRTGKVPGAKTIEDVKKAYESKVPMNRGCRTADVMTAIYYLIEQKYETGQALPVTGGQVMLS